MNYLNKLIYVLVIFIAMSSLAFGGEKVQLTDKVVDFYGYGKNFIAGDELTIYDPDGVLCGKYIIEKDRQYGFVHVYGDDKTDIYNDIDEGAETNDILTFYLNGIEISQANGEPIIWTNEGASLRVDF